MFSPPAPFVAAVREQPRHGAEKHESDGRGAEHRSVSHQEQTTLPRSLFIAHMITTAVAKAGQLSDTLSEKQSQGKLAKEWPFDPSS